MHLAEYCGVTLGLAKQSVTSALNCPALDTLIRVRLINLWARGTMVADKRDRWVGWNDWVGDGKGGDIRKG